MRFIEEYKIVSHSHMRTCETIINDLIDEDGYWQPYGHLIEHKDGNYIQVMVKYEVSEDE